MKKKEPTHREKLRWRPPYTDAQIGSLLKEERQFIQMRQQAVAKQLGVTRQVLSYIETGKRPIRATELATLCNLYRITPNGILGF